MSPVELTESHRWVLARLLAAGFQVVSFPLFPAYVGVQQEECAALLEPLPEAGFRLVGRATYLVAGQLSARVDRPDGAYFVWKSQQVPATPERLAQVQQFEARLEAVLLAET